MVNYHYMVYVVGANTPHFYVTTEQLNYLLTAVLPLGLTVKIIGFLPARSHRISKWDNRLYNHLLSSLLK